MTPIMNPDMTLNSLLSSNPVLANILSRTSIRRYLPDPLTPLQVEALLRAAMSAPSAVNRRPWEFYTVAAPSKLKALADALPYAKMAASAPMAIVVCGNSSRFLEGLDSCLWQQDCSAAAQNILLAAHALGLGAVWTCLFPHEDRMEPVRRILDIPQSVIPFCLIPVGRPLAPHDPLQKWDPSLVHTVL